MMIMYFLIFLISNSVCKPLNFQIAGSDRPSSALDFFRPINVNEMQANWDQATFLSYERASESYKLYDMHIICAKFLNAEYLNAANC